MKAAIYFFDNKVKQSFFLLQSGTTEEKTIFNQLNAAFDIIAPDPFCGIQIPKRLIPKTYLAQYRVDNLWKYNFHKNWRLMYTVASNGTTVIALIIEWLPHREYERRFGY